MHIQESKLDAQQLEIKHALDQLIEKLNQSRYWLGKIWSLFSNKQQKSIYLFGKVGRGKTMLMRYFYDAIKLPKKMLHFQAFMRGVHEKMHLLKTQNVALNIIVQKLAGEIAKEMQVLCLDEFEINDIADAMIIMRLFEELQNRNIVIFLTTNTKPDNLYLNGLQRASFLPFIANIHNKYQVLNLDQDKDYRYLNPGQGGRIFAPINHFSIQEITKIKQEIANGKEIKPAATNIFGRNINFSKTTKEAIFTDFSELFERNFSYADYGHITNKYHLFVVENVRPIEENETDLIIRLINFIDQVYYNNVLLFMTCDCRLEEIYQAGKKLPEFQRVLSRLNEMDGAIYLNTHQQKYKI